MSDLETYTGTCHCGKIAFEFQHPPLKGATAISCNCSICRRRGQLIVLVKDGIKFTNGSMDDLTKYQFGAKRLNHCFCPVCGSAVFGNSVGDPNWFGVNLRMVDGLDLDSLDIKKIDQA